MGRERRRGGEFQIVRYVKALNVEEVLKVCKSLEIETSQSLSVWNCPSIQKIKIINTIFTCNQSYKFNFIYNCTCLLDGVAFSLFLVEGCAFPSSFFGSKTFFSPLGSVFRLSLLPFPFG